MPTAPTENAPEPPEASARGVSLPLRRSIGLLFVALAIATIETSGRAHGLDPAALIPMAVLVGAAINGLAGGGIAALVGGTYIALYYASPIVTLPGAPARVLVGLAACALAVLIALALRDRVAAERRRSEGAATDHAALVTFADEIASESPEAVPHAIVRSIAALLDADMAVLTVLDPPSGRHIVRAAHGGNSSPVGVEVLPGVGVTGQAIRDRRMVVAGPERAASRLQRRLDGRGVSHALAAVPGIQAGRVICSVTIGRADGASFTASDRQLLAAISPLVTLALSGSLTRREMEDAAPRDTLTGLYNKAYLDAALEQLMALRRRTALEARPPLAAIEFDIDGFTAINERHGRHVGDHVLRCVATLLRQRFRQSDIVARVGADSFLVVMNGADGEIAAEAAAHVRRQVRDLSLASSTGEPVAVSLSAGCTVYQDGDRPEALYRSADAALEAARWSGPGAVVAI